jgi:hypothetical protein
MDHMTHKEKGHMSDHAQITRCRIFKGATEAFTFALAQSAIKLPSQALCGWLLPHGPLLFARKPLLTVPRRSFFTLPSYPVGLLSPSGSLV